MCVTIKAQRHQQQYLGEICSVQERRDEEGLWAQVFETLQTAQAYREYVSQVHALRPLPYSFSLLSNGSINSHSGVA